MPARRSHDLGPTSAAAVADRLARWPRIHGMTVPALDEWVDEHPACPVLARAESGAIGLTRWLECSKLMAARTH